jgi:catechol 2,3-dioxygenase-like lactoylglutathione lyase family enzyme
LTNLDLTLDHTGVAVRNLDEAEAAYKRLGFTLTTRSIHSGSVTPGAPVTPWGSGNYCAMFHEGYLEIIGITDPSLYSSTGDLLDKYEGQHIVAFGSGDADVAYEALSQRIDGVSPAAALERMADFGPDNSESKLAQFRNIWVDRTAMPEAKIIFIEHITPDVIWQPHLLDHLNGAVKLAEIALCVPDKANTCARLNKLLGREPKDLNPDFSTYEMERGRVYVLSEKGLASWAPGVTPPALPYAAGFGVEVTDLSATKYFLKSNGVTYHDHPYPAIWVGPEFTHGPVVSFIQS